MSRSKAGEGEIISLYVLGKAEQYCDSVIGGYNNTAICGSIGEDYASSIFPVTIKVKKEVEKKELISMLRDFIEAIEKTGFLIEAKKNITVKNLDGPVRFFSTVKYN